MYYSEYLQLEKLLDAQTPESAKTGKPAHDEMLFIIIHQAYELWFKQIIHELNSIRDIFRNPINDNSPGMQIAVHRLKRIATIFKLGVEQINTMETMTPLDFLDFRDLLRPASGFQSFQFKIIEAMLGLKMSDRHAGNYYVQALNEQHLQLIRKAESERSLLELINDWLERMPFFNPDFWHMEDATDDFKKHGFWQQYRNVYEETLLQEERENLSFFDKIFFENGNERRKFKPAAARAALFIMLYRDYPILQLPFQLLSTLLDIDETMATWRFRHMNMVHRMIGMRVGTGGSSGKDYLQSAMSKHSVFNEIADLTSFMINRNRLPVLTKNLEVKLGFERNE